EGALRALRVCNDELQMFFADQTLLYQHELTVEQRLGKVLTPWPPLAQRLRQLERHLLRQQLAIAQQHRGEIVVAQLRPHFGVERSCARLELLARQTESRRHRVAAKFRQQTGMPGRDVVKRIANMQAGNRASRTLDGESIVGIGKRDSRSVIAILDTRRKNADYALMPVFAIQTNPPGHAVVAA